MSQSTYAVAKARYEAAKDAARRQAAINVGAAVGINFYLSAWSRRAVDAYGVQWRDVPRPYPEGAWDWPEIFRRHQNDIDALGIVIWSPDDRLSGLGLLTTTGQAVKAEIAEGDPRPNCPLAGKRALIVLEVAACYAQALGKTEIRLEALNDDLAELYRGVYGFTLETPRKGSAYYRKEV